MAYTDTQHTHKRLAGLTGVALVHIALAMGLAAGLTIKYTQAPPEPRLKGTNVKFEIPPPPPVEEDIPEPTPSTDTADTTPSVPDTIIDLARSADFDVFDELPTIRDVPRVDTSVLERGNLRLPDPPPTFTPRDPVPRNGPLGWLSNADYPRRALQRGWEGDLTYALAVGKDGKVDDCRVINSTGHDILDRTACDIIKSKARFDPATDRTGAEVSGTYRGAVTWSIPGN